MYKLFKNRVLSVALLGCLALSLSACGTTREERIMIGTIAGAGIGAGVGALGGGTIVPGAAIGASAGAAIGAFAE